MGQEGHVLERRRASSLYLKGIYSFREGRKILTNSRRVKEYKRVDRVKTIPFSLYTSVSLDSLNVSFPHKVA